MPPFHPTAREIVLLTVLFTSLLFFSATFPRNSGSVTDILKTLPYVVEEELDTTPLTLETQYTLQALNRPLSWGAGPVPETKIVAHVPGELLVLYCALSLLFRSRTLAKLSVLALAKCNVHSSPSSDSQTAWFAVSMCTAPAYRAAFAPMRLAMSTYHISCHGHPKPVEPRRARSLAMPGTSGACLFRCR